MTLYHYTCRDGYAAIEASGWVLKPHAGIIAPLVWLTDMEEPDRYALGLTSLSLTCDRTEFRLVVHADSDACQWSKWCRSAGITRRQRDFLEFAPGAQPRRWWVSPSPVRCEP